MKWHLKSTHSNSMYKEQDHSKVSPAIHEHVITHFRNTIVNDISQYESKMMHQWGELNQHL